MLHFPRPDGRGYRISPPAEAGEEGELVQTPSMTVGALIGKKRYTTVRTGENLLRYCRGSDYCAGGVKKVLAQSL